MQSPGSRQSKWPARISQAYWDTPSRVWGHGTEKTSAERRDFQLCHLVPATNPREKSTRICDHVFGVGGGGVSLETGCGRGRTGPPSVYVQPTPLAKQGPDPVAAFTRSVTQTRALLCFCSFLFGFMMVSRWRKSPMAVPASSVNTCRAGTCSCCAWMLIFDARDLF